MPDIKPPLPQPNMIIARPAVMPANVALAAAKWVQIRKSSLFAFIGASGAGGVVLSRPFVDRIYKERKHFEGIDVLDVLLDHYGGSVEAAYQLVNFLRGHCKTLNVFIPDWAKSASTLIPLGADEFWMSDAAEIGPLDAQIPDPRDPDAYISALDEFRAVDYLRTHSFEILSEFSKMLARTTSLSTKDRLQLSIEYTTRLMTPLYANVDPLHFGGSHRSVENSTEYGTRVMSRYAYRDWTPKSIADVLKKLTWDYPSHTFVIDFQETESLGLKVKLMTGEINDLAHTITDGLTDAAGFLGKPDAKAQVAAAGGHADGQAQNASGSQN